MSILDTLAKDKNYVTPLSWGPNVTSVKIPHGDSIPLTAQQVMTATVEPSPNTGRSYVTVTFMVRIEADNTEAWYRQHFARGMCQALQDLEKELTDSNRRLAVVTGERDALAADARARAVVQSVHDAAAAVIRRTAKEGTP